MKAEDRMGMPPKCYQKTCDQCTTEQKGPEMDRKAKPPYSCKFCGEPSWYNPSDQTPPPDYCHGSDHGSPDDVQCGAKEFGTHDL